MAQRGRGECYEYAAPAHENGLYVIYDQPCRLVCDVATITIGFFVGLATLLGCL